MFEGLLAAAKGEGKDKDKGNGVKGKELSNLSPNLQQGDFRIFGEGKGVGKGKGHRRQERRRRKQGRRAVSRLLQPLWCVGASQV